MAEITYKELRDVIRIFAFTMTNFSEKFVINRLINFGEIIKRIIVD